MTDARRSDALAEHVAAWLPSQRWFGGKGRPIRQADIVDRAILRNAGAEVLLLLLDVRYEQDGVERYFVPLTATADGQGGPLGELRDAMVDPAACRALLAGVDQSCRCGTERGGEILFTRGPDFGQLRGDETEASVRSLGVEQSNTSVVLGDRIILKAFRRVYDGPNPDLEIPRFLATQTRFDSLPRLAGSIDYRGPDGGEASLGILQEFVRSQGDGWSWTLRALANGAAEHPAAYLEQIRALGQATAELHLALASDPDEPDFGPEPISAADLHAWRRLIGEWLDGALNALGARRATPSDQQAQQLLGGRRRLLGCLDALEQLEPGLASKTRYHGDFHLGQVLRTSTGWVVLDFEGEPLRPLSERRARHCPLKDVAGMLRSFNYARHTALRRQSGDESRLAAWEAATRAAYLEAYLERARGGVFVPRDPRAAQILLDAFELEKAAYELQYELNNRPDWVEIPLAFLAERATPR